MEAQIESISNPRMKRIQKLKRSARFRRQEGVFLAEGFKMVEEAGLYGCLESIYISTGLREGEEYFQTLSHKLKENCIEWVSPAVFREISDTMTPQGVLAVVKMPDYDKDELLKEEKLSLVCLEDIQDPGNLGTIFRTAEGAGMNAVVMSKGCVDLFNPKVVRATMGALFRLPFYVTDYMTTEVEYLKREGVCVYAACLGNGQDYSHINYPGKTAVLIGNEARGLRNETVGAASEIVHIPMEGKLESLNAAVSAALLMY